jgi:hypothetical protein
MTKIFATIVDLFMNKRHPWQPHELEYVRIHYPDMPTAEIARHLGRSPDRVCRAAYRQGLRKSPEYFEKYPSGRIAKSSNQGGDTRFKKGLTPWNKGKHFNSGGRSVHTRFKPGALPHNTRQDGDISERTDKNGKPYLYIRVELNKWKELHRYNWEQVRGPVPPGHILRFLNGDTRDCRVENLELISRKDNMRLNTIHRYPEEVKVVIRLTTKLKRKINKLTDAKKQD